MAKQIEGVYERILECAQTEFLNKGFVDASLRTIAQKAETSTGSIYTRFKDKNGLFGALVQPVIDEITAMANALQAEFDKRDAFLQATTMSEYCMTTHQEIIDFIYDNKTAFLLLFNSSYGSKYENFLDDLIDIEEKSTINYLKIIGRHDAINNRVSLNFIHNLAVLYCRGIFEPLLHGLSRKEAHSYDQLFTNYNTAGFNSVFGIKDENR